MKALLIVGLVLQAIGILFKLLVIGMYLKSDEPSELFGYCFGSIWFSIFFEVVFAIGLACL